MNILRIQAADGYEGLTVLDPNLPLEVFYADGQSRRDEYNPIKVQLRRTDENGRPLLRGDYPDFYGCTPCFSAEAATRMKGLLEQFGELLPLQCDGGKYFWYNVTTVYDCINWDKSEVVRLRSGRIIYVTQYCFIPERIASPSIFLAKGNEKIRLLVTPDVVSTFQAAGLRGMDIEKLKTVG